MLRYQFIFLRFFCSIPTLLKTSLKFFLKTLSSQKLSFAESLRQKKRLLEDKKLLENNLKKIIPKKYSHLFLSILFTHT